MGTGQVAGNHTSCEQQGLLDRQGKAGTSEWIGNHTSWSDKGPGGRQKKVGKGRNLLYLNITFSSLCHHYNKISLADKKYPSCICIMTLLIKTK